MYFTKAHCYLLLFIRHVLHVREFHPLDCAGTVYFLDAGIRREARCGEDSSKFLLGCVGTDLGLALDVSDEILDYIVRNRGHGCSIVDADVTGLSGKVRLRLLRGNGERIKC